MVKLQCGSLPSDEAARFHESVLKQAVIFQTAKRGVVNESRSKLDHYPAVINYLKRSLIVRVAVPSLSGVPTVLRLSVFLSLKFFIDTMYLYMQQCGQ
jgi:hypothetical protein